jgi:hypothetical protein
MTTEVAKPEGEDVGPFRAGQGGMTSFSSKWILSHSTWYKNPRSRHRAARAALCRKSVSVIEYDTFSAIFATVAIAFSKFRLFLQRSHAGCLFPQIGWDEVATISAAIEVPAALNFRLMP